MEFLVRLGEKIGIKKTKHAVSQILSLIKKCQKYGISYELMCRLNYYDLLAMVVEYDIDTIKENLALIKKKEMQVEDATNEDILNLHKRKRG